MIITENKLRKIIRNTLLEYKIYKGKDGIDKTQQGDWDESIKCPKCGKPMYLHMVLNDEKGSKELIGTVDKKGNLIDTEYQSIAIYHCPFCFYKEVRSNMA